ncbi:MAG TPA: polyprenyl synthetase [Chitinophagaceae bacterium]|nr:polyprenyl synthetase [Chitinophagaceae bacterium]
MHSFKELSDIFEKQFSERHFPLQPASLYDAAQYILQIGGKRVRPVCVLMANELFDDLGPDAFHVANAIELFHNFSLVHDDIMDAAPLRRGLPTVHKAFGDSTALLAGDVMLVQSYDFINRIQPTHVQEILSIFNQTAREVCEGQQLDMDFEKRTEVSLDEYVHMIELKTSVLLAACLKMGAILGGSSKHNQDHLYAFGKNLGIAFQVQDDYLDAFGDPAIFGKQPGGDILANKKTFLMIHARETAGATLRESLDEIMSGHSPDKVGKVLDIFRKCGSDQWATSLKETYYAKAMQHLEEVAVIASRKKELEMLARFLLQRDR